MTVVVLASVKAHARRLPNRPGRRSATPAPSRGKPVSASRYQPWRAQGMARNPGRQRACSWLRPSRIALPACCPRRLRIAVPQVTGVQQAPRCSAHAMSLQASHYRWSPGEPRVTGCPETSTNRLIEPQGRHLSRWVLGRYRIGPQSRYQIPPKADGNSRSAKVASCVPTDEIATAITRCAGAPC
jgi:hypothetical protein